MNLKFMVVTSERTDILKEHAGTSWKIGHIKHDQNKTRFNGMSIEELGQVLIKMQEMEDVRMKRLNKADQSSGKAEQSSGKKIVATDLEVREFLEIVNSKIDELDNKRKEDNIICNS